MPSSPDISPICLVKRASGTSKWQWHEPFEKSRIVCQSIAVLLIATQHDVILLAGADVVTPRDAFSAVSIIAKLRERIVREIVQHPVLVFSRTARPGRCGIVDVEDRLDVLSVAAASATRARPAEISAWAVSRMRTPVAQA